MPSSLQAQHDTALDHRDSRHLLHAVTDNGVAFPHEGEHGLDLWPIYLLAGSFVGECSLDIKSLELSRCIVINRATRACRSNYL